MLKLVRLLTLAAAFAGALLFLAGPVQAQPAPDANSVLILSSVDGGGLYSTAAAARGFTVVLATDAEWSARTTADFATFRALILGDPNCSSTVPAAALANNTVWAAAIDGPKLFIGTDEALHSSSGGGTFLNSGIGYVTSGGAGQTGAYVSLSCYYSGDAPTTVALLAPFGTFTVDGTIGCYDDSHIVAIHPALAGSTDATLSNWGCSVHEVFRSFPAGFIPLAIAENIVGVGNLTFADGTNGVPYILASGGGIVAVGTTSAIPTMSEWAMIVMAALLAVTGFYFLRRRSR